LLLLMLFQFILYYEVADRFFPLRQSVNVTAVRPCTGECRRRVFLNAHLDAAWEWPMNYHFGGVVFEVYNIGATLGVLYYIVLTACRLCGAANWTLAAGLAGILFFPFWIGLSFLRDRSRMVGSYDNLDLYGMENCYRVLLRTVQRLDGGALDSEEQV